MNTNSGVPTLGVRIIAQTRVPVPAIHEQKKIAAALTCLTQREHVEETTLESTRATKSALMSVLLTGEVRVTPDEAAP